MLKLRSQVGVSRIEEVVQRQKVLQLRSDLSMIIRAAISAQHLISSDTEQQEQLTVIWRGFISIDCIKGGMNRNTNELSAMRSFSVIVQLNPLL